MSKNKIMLKNVSLPTNSWVFSKSHNLVNKQNLSREKIRLKLKIIILNVFSSFNGC